MLGAWANLTEEAAALCFDRPALGLDIGAGVPARHVGALGYLVRACDTLGDAFAAYQRYERLFCVAGIAEVRPTVTNVSLSWPPGGGADRSADNERFFGCPGAVRANAHAGEHPPGPAGPAIVQTRPIA